MLAPVVGAAPVEPLRQCRAGPDDEAAAAAADQPGIAGRRWPRPRAVAVTVGRPPPVVDLDRTRLLHPMAGPVVGSRP